MDSKRLPARLEGRYNSSFRLVSPSLGGIALLQYAWGRISLVVSGAVSPRRCVSWGRGCVYPPWHSEDSAQSPVHGTMGRAGWANE